LAATGSEYTSDIPESLVYAQELASSSRPAANLEETFHSSSIQARRIKESELPNLDYDIIFRRGFILLLPDMCKIAIKYLAGCRLSWWPLAEPEDPLRPNQI
jgi:hypothetical protein